MARKPAPLEKAEPLSTADRENMIAVAAYRRVEPRGFKPGGDIQDWLEAEAEIDQLLNSPRPQH